VQKGGKRLVFASAKKQNSQSFLLYWKIFARAFLNDFENFASFVPPSGGEPLGGSGAPAARHYVRHLSGFLVK